MLFHSVNGQISQDITINDRATNYGDGLFTTAEINNGQISLLNYHVMRLTSGCEKLAINGVDFTWLQNYLVALAKNYRHAVLKVLISAGAGGRGYSRIGVAHATVVVSVFDFPKHYQTWQQTGINLGVADTKLGINPLLSGLKHLNRLEQVFVRRELDQRPEDDLLVLNINEQVIETSSANIFYYHHDTGWQTPDLNLSGVNGVMRQHILAQQNDILVTHANLDEVKQASAMFICNSVAKIIPVKCFAGRTLDLSQVQKIVQQVKDTFAC